MAFSCNHFLAHINPEELLVDHLKLVGEACRRRLEELGHDGLLLQVGELVGKTHDFGKYNTFFQEYMRSGIKGSIELYSHAPLSAAYCAYAIKSMTNDPLMSLLGSFSVWHHHQSLNIKLKDFCIKLNEFPENPNYERQLKTLQTNIEVMESDMKILKLPSIDGFLKFVYNGELKEFVKSMYRSVPGSANFGLLYKTLLLFSVLIDSDKRLSAHLDTSQAQSREKFLDAKFHNLTEFIDSLKVKDQKINAIRAEIRDSTLKELENIIKSREIPKLMYISAPTGTGKTLLSIECALKLRAEIQRRTGRNPRIIYVLPYINIIEQTYGVLKKALNDNDEYIIKHHHLYAPGQKNNDREDLPNETKMMLVESWDSEMIVTTFVQLIETLVGTRNRMLKKFNKILDSIIILDEVQAFRPELWGFITECLKELPEGCHVIMMSATMPQTFSTQARPLLKDSIHYFEKMNRIRYEYINQDMQFGDLADFALQKWEKRKLLVVLNTIRSSIAIYRLLKEKLGTSNPICLGNDFADDYLDNKRPLLAYLSTNIVPRDRLNRINTINSQLKNGRPVILVSTQVVEAGVDLDFDTVIREVAPLDSIAQAGGRCNRNWKPESGTVYIIRLKDGDRFNWQYIYSPLSINELTEPFFAECAVVEEKEFGRKILQYYARKSWVESIPSADESKEYMEAVTNINFCKLSELKLIKDMPKASVFVNLNDESNSRLEYLRNVVEEKKRIPGDYSLINKLKYAWVRAQEYIIDTWNSNFLPVEELVSGEVYASGVKLIDREVVDVYYDKETGLKAGDSLDAVIF
jgi:CRISPR-associated endonuclease/helicase Cas3